MGRKWLCKKGFLVSKLLLGVMNEYILYLHCVYLLFYLYLDIKLLRKLAAFKMFFGDDA